MSTNELLHALRASVIQSLILTLIIIDFLFHYRDLSIMKINKFFQLFFLDIDNFILISFLII